MNEAESGSQAQLGNQGALPLPLARRVNAVCNQFERAWKAGQRPGIEEYLGDTPEPARSALLRELIALEIACRRRAGETPREEDYQARFPYLSLPLEKEKVSGTFSEELADVHPPYSGPEMVPDTFFAEVPGHEILGVLGRGGMGVVYKARQLSLNRTVAVKKILAGDDASPAELARFRHEAEAAACLQHPNIVQIHEVGQQDGRPYLVLEYVDGGSLAEQLAGTPQPARAAAQLVETLARAMHFAHEHGIVHRDLKPANVMLARGTGGLPVLPDGQAGCLSHDLVPKITDFGLAKRLDGGPGLTASGAIVGTPSYMAPEQAAGKGKEVGPAADVYALGGILYECLTGRPPFKAQTPLDTVLQVLADDPVPPARFQPKMPRDLETICLKCLQKQPRQRYGSARELAEDLRRFEAGEPIRARPAGPLEQLIKWVKRRPLAATLGAVSLAVMLAGAGSWLWLAQDRAQRGAATTRAVEQALQEATLLRLQSRAGDQAASGKALAAVTRAQTLLERGEGEAGLVWRVQQLREQLKDEEKDRDMVVSLEEIRLRQTDIKDDTFDMARADQEYAQAFRDYGIDVEGLEQAESAHRIGTRAIKVELAAALDDWALVRLALVPKLELGNEGNAARWQRLVEIARLADSDPWRDRVRTALVQSDKEALQKLAAQKEVATLSPPTLVLLGKALVLADNHSRAVQLLQHAQHRYPGDFWINYQLASFHLDSRPPQADAALRFATAALALRSKSAGAHFKLGLALQKKRQWDEASAAYRRAIEISGNYTMAHNNLGIVHYHQEQLDKAIAAYGEAIRSNKNHPQPHYNLGLALAKKGQVGQAIAAFREAVRINKDFASAHLDLGIALEKQGQVDESIASFQEALRSNKDHARTHFNLGNALKKKGQLDQAIAAYREAIRLKPDYAVAYTNLGIALAKNEQVDEAIGAFHEVLGINRNHPQAHYNLGVALYRKGQVDEAIAEYRAAIRSNPDYADAHNNLAGALEQKGKADEAIAEYREAIRSNKNHPRANYNLGLALHKQGKLDQAIDAYRAGIQVDKNYAKAHDNLGRALAGKGQVEEAIQHFGQAIKLDPKGVEAHMGLGMALRSQGRLDEALDSLQRGRQGIAPTDSRLHQLQQMIHETESMRKLAPRLAVILKGEAKPADAGERLVLATLCRVCQQRYLAAACFCAEAFAERPALAEDLKAAHRYHAACAAALAGCGQGKDAQKLDDKERARWRQQALDWLRADLALRTQQLNGGPAEAAEAGGKLAYWQRDQDLAGLRDNAALAKLPEDERAAWGMLWDEVADVLQRAHRPK
jgi:tetratricopeptide (TPR) repeat protein